MLPLLHWVRASCRVDFAIHATLFRYGFCDLKLWPTLSAGKVCRASLTQSERWRANRTHRGDAQSWLPAVAHPGHSRIFKLGPVRMFCDASHLKPIRRVW
jgi:hypothetical protein